MRALATSDVSLNALRELSSQLGSEFELGVDERQIAYKSVSAPSWIMFFAEADWWIKLLGAYVGLYIAEIVKEAGKDTWKNRAKIGAAVASVPNRVGKFAVALARLRKRIPATTRINVGLSLPNDYDGTRFELVGSDADELAMQLALFINHLPAVLDLIRNENLNKNSVATGIQLLLQSDGSVQVCWQRGDTLQKEDRLLPLRN